MYSYNYPENMNIGRVCLELSLKPFKQLDDEYINLVCTRLFMQWKSLLNYSGGVAVMLWTSDGSEILEYSGNLDDEFEWGRYIGIGNPACVKRELYNNDERYLHVKPVLYCENPPVMHYSDLKRIITAIKTIGKQILGVDVMVGETFDPGPEFAYSDFKFHRHKEINKGDIMDAWIHCASVLHADSKKYAAFPDGIPEGTQLGEFLSKQFAALKQDVGFDYLWLSNGFGFSLDSWNWKGEVFDGERFNSNAENVIKSIKKFWNSYTPNTDFVTEVRGSNLSAGMDIASHGCPIDQIYKNNIIAPPNSPWAALDSRFGLELVGYMSRMSETPENGYSFRYYTHDPWWLNSPWFDRYGRSPHDIYLPLAVTRINADGKTEKPATLNFLSADDSFGDTPERCPVEVIPHILEGYRSYPDAPGAVTWLYPFDYYCKIGLYENKMDRMMMDDWFIEQAIEQGFPVSTVVSDRVFGNLDLCIFKNTVIVTPVPEEGTDFEKCIFKAVEAGLMVILYGSTKFASEKLRTLIGVKLSDGISGNLIVSTDVNSDSFETGFLSNTILHNPIVSNGYIYEIPDGSSEVCATVSVDGKERVYATYKTNNVAWVRGSFPHNTKGGGRLPALFSRGEYFPPALLMRLMLKKFGYNISFSAYSIEDKLPLILMSSHNGGIVITSFSKDETVKTILSTPYGAPVINNTTVFVDNSRSHYNLPKWTREVCRVFVRQDGKSKIGCRVNTPGDTIYNDRRIEITGLSDSVVTFMPENNSVVSIYKDGKKPIGECDYNFTTDENGYIVTEKISGAIQIVWQDKNTREQYIKSGYIK